MIRPSHACRINLNVFASNPSTPEAQTPPNPTPSATESSKSDIRPDAHEPSDSCNQVPLRAEVPPTEETNPAEESSRAFEDGLTPSQLQDLHNPKQSEKFRNLSPEEKSMLLRAHKNLGHPSPERLSTMLRSQGFRAEVARAALELTCSVCKSQCQPQLARPGTIKDELDFNDRICIDGLQWTNQQGQNFHVYHVVDWSTSFQTACCAPDRSSSAAIQGLIQMWLSWAGAPSEMIVDAATEFNSEEFELFTQSHNIKVTTISVEAQFQNGKAERHGSILKSMLSKFDAEHPINNYKDLQNALWWCTQAKNACSLRKGYAPEVLVLDKHTRIPGAVCNDEMLPAHLLADSETAQGLQFRKQLAIRESARRAYHHADNDAALRRAFLRCDRPSQSAYSPGEWVMVRRPGKGSFEGQPDLEPEAPPSQAIGSQQSDQGCEEQVPENPELDPAITTPVPADSDDDLVCDNLLCVDDEACLFSEPIDLPWRLEVDIKQQDLDMWRQAANAADMAFVASAAKHQRSEVKLSSLSPSEKEEFQKAKNSEINNWIKTGTISKILREKTPYEQILRCRWILTWKSIDDNEGNHNILKDGKRVKAKARLVILGYLDPQLEELPRDSPTLGRNSKMNPLAAQSIYGMGSQIL
eukprot:s26_g39.t1